jgi:hypothetical protein
MTLHTCNRCSAQLGPWENDRCLKCTGGRRDNRCLSIADLGVLVLEREEAPLSAYDIRRVIHREMDEEVSAGSMLVSLSVDLRFCWAGKGVYGLFRHGIAPGPRSLSGVACLFLFANEEPMEPERLAFGLKYCGYRFQVPSLVSALCRTRIIQWPEYTRCTVPSSNATRRQLRRLRLVPKRTSFEGVLEWCRALLDDADEEYKRRLSA